MTSEQVAPGQSTDLLAIGQITLIGLFVTALVTAQLTAAKLLALPLPASYRLSVRRLCCREPRWPTR